MPYPWGGSRLRVATRGLTEEASQEDCPHSAVGHHASLHTVPDRRRLHPSVARTPRPEFCARGWPKPCRGPTPPCHEGEWKWAGNGGRALFSIHRASWTGLAASIEGIFSHEYPWEPS